ncbi:MAG: radical SAM protein [Candidatus Electryonea clarkiae]|nr:radical SAM protein [Candidatus Electryonea clarkiae]MDP8288243.1 radical SAM protein [Candidatus Electryonea clarkiae]
MRICLATPPLISDNPHEPLSIPLGIAYLGAILEEDGHEVALIDGAINGSVRHISASQYFIGSKPGELARQIMDFKPDLIGLSCPFTTRYKLFSECIASIRELSGNIPILVGGIHPTLFPQRVLEKDSPDVVFLGEAEIALREIVRRFDQQGVPDPEGLDGVAWQKNGNINISSKQSFVEDLDSLPEPARHLFPVETYLKRSGGRWAARRKSILSILSSRSCPGRCSFCSIHAAMGLKWRAHSSERVLNELENIVNRWNPSLIGFEDDRLTWDRDRLVAICEGIVSRGISTQWYTPNGVHINDLDEELLGLMKKSGCNSLNLAIESGDPTILNKVIGKKATNRQALEIAAACRETGIRTNGYFVIGMPGETDESIQRSLDLCLEMKLDGLGLFIATPFPGTRMYRQCVKSGYIDPANFTEEFLEAGDPDMLHKPLFATETMSKERLLWWEKEFNRQFMKQLYRRRPSVRVKFFIKRVLQVIS